MPRHDGRHLVIASSRRSGAAGTPGWRRLALLVAPLLIGGVAWPVAVRAQSATATPVPAVSAQEIRATLDELQASTDLPADVRQKAADLYQQALGELSIADTWNAKAEGFRTARTNAPHDLDELRAQLARPVAEPRIEAPEGATLELLKASQVQAESARVAAQRALAELDVQTRYRSDRGDEIRVLDAAAKARLEDLDKQLEALPETAELRDPLRRSNRVLLLARRTKTLAERTCYQEELPSYDATRDVLRAKLDLATRQLHQAEQIDRRWKEILAERSRADAELKARDARWAVLTARPEVIPLAQENEKLAELRNSSNGPAARLKAIERQVAAINAERSKLQAQFAHVRKITQLTDAVGQLLQRQRDALPDLRVYRAELDERQSEIAELKLHLLEYEGRRNELADVDSQVKHVVSNFTPPPADEQRADIEAAVRDLLVTRRDYLDALITDYNSYFQSLALELDRNQRELVREVEEYAEFINERILWIRSSTPLGADDLGRTASAVLWLTDIDRWREVADAWLSDFQRHRLLNAILLTVLIALFVTQPVVRKIIRRLDDDVSTEYSATIVPTLRVLGLTLRVAAPVPATLLYLAWRIAPAWQASPFCKSVAFALEVTAVAWAATDFFRQVCRHHGLAEVHFGWSHPTVSMLRRNFRWLLLLGAPIVFVVAMIHQQESDSHNASLGRLCFIAGSLLLAAFAWRMTSGLERLALAIPECEKSPAAPGLYKLGKLVAVGIPLALATIATVGYYYTALVLTCRLQVTLWLLQGLMLAHAVALRWLLVARRRVAIKQARQRRSGSIPVLSDTSAPPADDGPCDLSMIDVQTKRLLRGIFVAGLAIGVWLIWVDVLPALKYLDQWPLWSYSETVLPPGQEGAPAPAPQTVTRWITVRDLLMAATMLILTLLATRNLTGLLEIAWLQRLPLDAASRYTLTAVTRYVILLVGGVATVRALGIGWNNVQWLVAAITVGLGFGLQEIFANFVSGLIVLVERPIRVGDTVTVGGVSGTVSRIRARATTITDWDRKELIVPNKEFITGQVVNWTLSDSILRLIAKVGVAYNSDVDLVVRLLKEVATQHPAVLHQPEPVALLAEFGDSALQFELRVFVSGLEHYLSVKHHLNVAIDQVFRANGIEIPFPQCEVHVIDPMANRSIEPTRELPRVVEKRSA